MRESLISAVAQGYLTPRKSFERQIQNASEERALLYVFIFCFFSFVSRVPAIIKTAPDDMVARIGAAFVGSMCFAPLLLYAVAGLAHLLLSKLGGQGDYLGARLTTFWATLLSVPFVLLGAILSEVPVFSGIVPLFITFGFFFFWAVGLSVLEALPMPKIFISLVAVFIGFVALAALLSKGIS